MKKIIAVMLAVLMILPTFSGLTYADTYQPIVGLQSDMKVQTIKSGEDVKLIVPIVNDSPINASKVKVTISGDHPFKNYTTDLVQQVGLLKPYVEKELVYELELKANAESRYYEFDVVFNYINNRNDEYETVDKMVIKVENNEIEPNLGVVSYHSVFDIIKPGVEDGLVLYIKNSGTLNAKDIKINLSGFNNEGIILENDLETKFIHEIDAGETGLISYKVKAGVNAQTGTVPITAEINYIDDYGNEYSKTSIMYYEVEGKDTSGADIQIIDVSYPTKLDKNKDFDVTFTVKNSGVLDLDKVEMSVEYPSDVIAKTPSKKVLSALKAGETYTFTTTLRTKSEMSMQNYDGWINVDYHVKGATSDDTSRIQEYLGFFVEASESGSKPKLIIDNYEYGGEYVYAGEPYELVLYIKNTSTSESTRNIKVTLSSEDSVFTPVDSSSSFFINNIGPNQVYKHIIDLKTKIDASVKIYALSVKMEYEDGSGNAYDDNDQAYAESEDLSIAVAQPVRLETADLVVPWEIYVGQPFYIEQEFYNMGKSTMYNMMVRIEGVDSNESNYFVGNFDAGSQDYFSSQCFANEEGEFEGKLTYSFEDALGNVTTKEETFNYSVLPAMDMGFDDGMNGGDFEPIPVEEPGLPVGKIAIGLIVVAAIVAFIVFRKRRQKRLLRELEDLDE